MFKHNEFSQMQQQGEGNLVICDHGEMNHMEKSELEAQINAVDPDPDPDPVFPHQNNCSNS